MTRRKNDELRVVRAFWGPFDVAIDVKVRELWSSVSREDVLNALVELRSTRSHFTSRGVRERSGKQRKE